jgi:type II secretory pathway component GspD/PulD (secretin)
VQKATNVIRVEQPPRVTFDFVGADVKEVIDAIAKYAGTSVVTAPEVKGEVHLRLNDVPWRTALDTVAKTLGFVVVEEEWGIYRITSPDKLTQQLETRVFTLKYRPPAPYTPKIDTNYADDNRTRPSGDATKDFTLINALKSALTKSGSLEYHARENMVVVTDTAPALDQIERILNEIDVEPAQVFIDVKFVTTSNNDVLNYGVDIGDEGFSIGISGAAIPSRLPFSLGGGGFGSDIVANTAQNIPGLDAEQTLNAVTFGTLDFTKATATLNLLKRDQGSRIVQAPKLLALDNQEATIFVGRTIRYAETEASSNQSGGLTFSIREAQNSPVQTGFQLFMVPHVVPGSDKIIMTVVPEAEQLVGTSSDPELAGFQVFTSGQGTTNEVSIALPQISSSTLVSTLMLESGETAVIGGLITEQEAETINKLPVLGDIPILGFFFKSVSRSVVNESLYIFITPRIIRDSESYAEILKQEEVKRQSAIEAEVERIWSGVDTSGN